MPADRSESVRSGPGDPADELLRIHGAALAAGITAALPAWVMRCVVTRTEEAAMVVDDTLAGAAAVAGAACAAEFGPRVEELLALDIDAQGTTPLAVLRAAVVHPTRVLEARAVPPPARDDFAVRAFPDDPYDLTPTSFADLSEDLAEAGIVWGAAKAHVHLARRRADGQR